MPHCSPIRDAVITPPTGMQADQLVFLDATRRRLQAILVNFDPSNANDPPELGTTVEGALPPESFSVGDEPVALAIADFNPGSDPNSPLPDIATADHTADTVTILLQNPAYDPQDPNEPRFLSSSFSPGDGPSDIEVADLNGDGHVDIAVSLENDHTVEIWEGDGTGSFTFAISLQPIDANDIALQSPTPSGLFIGDFGIATSNLVADKIVVWKNFSTSTTWSFSAATFYTVGDQPTGIAGGDVNGDGILDLVTANKGSNNGTILPGTGSGNFGSPITIPAGIKPWRVIVGQFLGDDTVADIAFACGVSDDIVIVERDPHNPGSYRIGTRLACGETPRAVASGDCNGDGVADLVSADLDSDAVSIHFRALQPITDRVDRLGYSGYFDVEVTDTDYPVADPNDPNLTISMESFNSPVAVRILDFDGDGKNDLVSSSLSSKSQIQVLERDPSTHLFEIVFQHPPDPAPSVRFTALATGQFDDDGDGYQDFVAANEKNDELRFFKSDGSGGFTVSTPLSLRNLGGGQGPSDAQVRGVRYLLPVHSDGDGIVDDLYVVCGLGGAVIRLENDGDGNFSYSSHAVLSSEPHQIVAADLNGDGGIDLAVTLAATNKVKVFLTSGSTSDALQTTASANLTIPAPEALGVGDFDGDDDIDLVVTSLSTNNLYLYLNNGSGTLTLQGTHACGPGALEVAVADLDGDEKDDVVVVNAFGEADKMLTNRSSHYSRPVTYSSGEVERIAAIVIDASGFGQIAVIDLAATVLPRDTIVTSTATHHGSFDVFHSGLTWNPEGTRLYFQRDALGEVASGLVVLRIE